MFAVIRAGGKQFRVVKDDRISVERMAGEPGTMIELSDVLMLGGDGQAPKVGRPAVDKAAVFAEVLEHYRSDKVLVFKKKRRNNYRRKGGHRQGQTLLRIVGVSPTGEKPDFAPTPKKEPRPETKKKAKAKAPAKEADADTRPAKKAEEKAAPKKKADKAAKEEAPKKKAPAKKKPAKGKSKE